ncbi:DNA dC-_dU-editing enzyme APOBEC-3A [Molossus molossus]|uniref:DNA dC->dU-editing enzyme APOBEC-3G n=1 Tax=Molossus molossus TaxID=27622 RepID=A0A7J8FV72_MOLMO|nr:DNA dC->dU-editing enzyme APOBEC-3A [Molossus molossus]KAF6451597.1 hypothetical protein HJG59_000849 [Molossus molossus]
MEADQAPSDRHLMDKYTFTHNFGETQLHQTYLCYEVKVFKDDSQDPVKEFKGFLRNQGRNPGPRRHAELCFLDLIPSWNLDEKLCTITCFISWSPCYDCALQLAAFLVENSHVSLSIFCARIYSISGYKQGLLALQNAGAQIAIMTSKEMKYCWETFVDNKGQEFQPQDNLDKTRNYLSMELEKIIRKTEGWMSSL